MLAKFASALWLAGWILIIVQDPRNDVIASAIVATMLLGSMVLGYLVCMSDDKSGDDLG